MSSSGISGLDSVLLSYYQAQLNSSPSAISAASQANAATTASSDSATANDDPPWNTPQTQSNAETAQILSTTNFINTSNVPLTAGATSDSKLEQDNQKLFSLYNAVSNLSYLAQL